MTTLEEAAFAALEAQRTAQIDTARTLLGDVLAGYDVTTLTVADRTDKVAVFTDGSGVYLAVRAQGAQGAPVALVEAAADGATGWTEVGQVVSLASLGVLLGGGA